MEMPNCDQQQKGPERRFHGAGKNRTNALCAEGGSREILRGITHRNGAKNVHRWRIDQRLTNTRLHDLSERARIQTGASNQSAVDVWFTHQLGRILRFDATAVLDAHFLG